MAQRAKPRPPPRDPNVLERNNTSFPARSTAKLRELYKVYLAAQSDGADPQHRWSSILKYYQYLVRVIMSDPEYGIGADGNARGLLLFGQTGLGKTRAAVAVMMALWDLRPIVVMLPRSLQKNFRQTVLAVTDMLNPELAAAAAAGDLAALDKLARLQAAALAKIAFVSMDAYNSADQMARAGTGAARVKRGDLTGATGGLDGKALIVDEAHNFFRAIINSSAENANARRVYDMIMAARDLRLLFLTGTPAGKDPFECVPCFNMLAGKPILPVQYELFYSMYIDRATHSIKNRGKLANRLVGLVSHVGHSRPTIPCAAAAPRRGELRAGEPPAPYDWRIYSVEDLLAAPAPEGAAVAALIRVHRGGPAHLPTLATLRDEFAGRKQHVLVVTAAGAPTDVALIARADADIDADTTGAGHLSMIHTAEAHRRRGLCAAAVEYLMAAVGATAYTLEVYDDNAAAIACYKKLGFAWNDAVEEATPRSPNGGREPRRLRPMIWRSGAAKVPRDDGWFPEERPTIVERVEMGPDQYRQYLLAREKEELEGKGGEGGRPAGATPPLSLPGSEKKAMKSYFVHSRMLSLFAPAREWAAMSIADMPAEAFSPEAGPKLALIADRVVAAPGPVLVYSQFVERGGLKPLGRYLQARGLKQYIPVVAPKPAKRGRPAAPAEVSEPELPRPDAASGGPLDDGDIAAADDLPDIGLEPLAKAAGDVAGGSPAPAEELAWAFRSGAPLRAARGSTPTGGRARTPAKTPKSAKQEPSGSAFTELGLPAGTQLVHWTQDELLRAPAAYQARIVDMLAGPGEPLPSLRELLGEHPHRAEILQLGDTLLAVAFARLADGYIFIAVTPAEAYRSIPIGWIMVFMIMQAEPEREYWMQTAATNTAAIACVADWGFVAEDCPDIAAGQVRLVGPAGAAPPAGPAAAGGAAYVARGQELHGVRGGQRPAGTKERAAPGGEPVRAEDLVWSFRSGGEPVCADSLVWSFRRGGAPAAMVRAGTLMARARRDGPPAVRGPPPELSGSDLFSPASGYVVRTEGALDDDGPEASPRLARMASYRTQEFTRDALLSSPEPFRTRVTDLIRGFQLADPNPDNPALESLEQLLGAAPQRIVVLSDGGAIIAVARVELEDGFVGLVRTSLAYRGQGYCKRVVRALMAAEPDREYWLQTNVDNPAAVACYKACGFVIANPPDIGPNEVRMVRPRRVAPGGPDDESFMEYPLGVVGGGVPITLWAGGGREKHPRAAHSAAPAPADSRDPLLLQFSSETLQGAPAEYQERVADVLRAPDDRTSTLRELLGDAPRRLTILHAPPLAATADPLTGEIMGVAVVRLADGHIFVSYTVDHPALCKLMVRSIMRAEPDREYQLLVDTAGTPVIECAAACGFCVVDDPTLNPAQVRMVRPAREPPSLGAGGAAVAPLPPPLVIRTYLVRGKELHVVRDDQLPAGTKQRAAPAFVRGLLRGRPGVTALLYTAPYNGYGPVAAAYAAQALGLRCFLILSRKAFGAPRAAPLSEVEASPTVRAAAALGAVITITDTWPDLVAAGAVYADRPDVCWLPLGFQDGAASFSGLLAAAIGAAAPAAMRPKRIWVAGGTGALAVALAMAFPAAEIRVVPASLEAKTVGKLVAATAAWPRIRVEPAHVAHTLPAPYPTVAGYDERAWDSAAELGESGDYVWNVAGWQGSAPPAPPASAAPRPKTPTRRHAEPGRGRAAHGGRPRSLAKRRHSQPPRPPAPAADRPADQARDADRAPAEDFPYRAAFMPPAAEMFGRLRALARHPPAEWAAAGKAEGKIAIVRRSYPEDYDATDSITDHFVERIRIGCRERNEDSPAAAWEKLRGRADLPAGARARRELVYSAARGCNLFNAALAAYLVGRFGAGGNVLDCTAGWGDRLVAAHAGGARSYRGWDTNPDLQPVYAAIGAAFGAESEPKLDWKVELAPFEAAEAKFQYGGVHAGRFDMAFLCPPYFDKEVYQGPGTSTEAHPTEEQWYAGFYRRAVRAAAGGLKPGGYLLAYVPPGRMQAETATILSELGFSDEGAVGFQQVVVGKRAIDRDTFVWRRRRQAANAWRGPARHGGDEPAAVDVLPLDDGPSADGDGPASDGDGPASDGDGPASDGDGPASDGDRPASDGDRPASDEDRPASDEDAGSAEWLGELAGADWHAMAGTARAGIEQEWAAYQLTQHLFGALPNRGRRAFTEGRNAIERWILAGANEAPWRPGAWALHRTLLAAPDAAAKFATELAAVGFDGARVAAALTAVIERAVRADPAHLESVSISVTADAVRVGVASAPDADAIAGAADDGPPAAPDGFYVRFPPAQGLALLDRVRDLPAPDAAAAVARMALRYAAAAAGGQQLGLPRAHYAALYAAGVRNEAFASPLNSRLLPLRRRATRFCSLFPDTDEVFGSAGRFFDADLGALPGDWTVNPPYIEALMLRTAERVLELLAGRTPRRAFVLLPAWDDAVAVRAVADSPLAAHTELLAKGTFSLEEPDGRVFTAPFSCVYVALQGPRVDAAARAAMATLCRAAHTVAEPPVAGGGASADASADEVEGGAVGLVPPSWGGGAWPGGTYAIISGEVPEEERDAIMAVCASPANAHGAIIKGILVSKTGAEGLDLKNIRETICAEPYWDEARPAQVRGRASRLGSHDAVPRAERIVQPRIYLAVPNKLVWERALDKEAKTIDELFYDRAQDKYQTNVAMRQLLAEVCYECQLFGYGRCRVCVPTNVPLFHDDPALDIRLPDPCTVQAESDVVATPLVLGDTTYYYVPAAGSAFGYTFYQLRGDLGGYAAIDPADPVIAELLRALRAGESSA